MNGTGVNDTLPSLQKESDISGDCTGVNDTPQSSQKELDKIGDGTGVNDTPPSSQKESGQNGDGTGVKDIPSSSQKESDQSGDGTFWRDKKFWIQMAILVTIQLYVFSYIIMFAEKWKYKFFRCLSDTLWIHGFKIKN